MAAEELKPCPFCGSDSVQMSPEHLKAYVFCEKCGTHGPVYWGDQTKQESQEKASIAWNLATRPSPWISVEDRLPEKGASFLGWCETDEGPRIYQLHMGDWGDPEVAVYCLTDDCWWGSYSISDMTHWQPIVGPNDE